MDQETTSNPETEARALGWSPKENWKGDPSHWVDAETFLERGRTMMPLLKANNKRLEQQLQSQAAELQQVKQLLQNSTEAIEALKEFSVEAKQQGIREERARLTAELRTAREDGNIEREMEIQADLTELQQTEKAVSKQKDPAPKGGNPPEPQLHPDFKGWADDNKWFGTDARKTQRAMAIAQELRSYPENDELQGRAFYDKVVEVMEERSGGGTGAPKVGGSRPSGGGSGGSGGKSYGDLPPDAKAACDRQGKKLVGPGRAFKDEAAWRSHYASVYFKGE